jgi:uncharacterized protein (TIGR03435 family)
VYDISVDTNSHEPWPAMLEYQLGLKLHAGKTLVKVTVVDKAATP